ncbi:MAG: proline dehydrogenase [Granulosicoccus sp.]|jgi:proline dehydrogenase
MGLAMKFDDTEIAFSDKTDYDLRRAQWLFSLVGSPAMVKLGSGAVSLALGLHLPVKGLIRQTVFKQFCGGESIEKSEGTIARLYASDIRTILDFSAEGKETESDFNRAAKETMASIEKAKEDLRIPFGVFKPTGLARMGLLEKLNKGERLSKEEEKEKDLVMLRIRGIILSGVEHDVPVHVDAEETWIQDAVDDIVYDLMLEFNREKVMVFNTVQLYRNDRLDYLKNTIDRAKKDGIKSGFKLVRGAYMEKERERAEKMGYPSPIHKTKEDTDRDYDLAIDVCLDNYPDVSVFAGTHNEKSSAHLAEEVIKRGIDKGDMRIFFAQLYGMSDHISYNLAKQGFNVLKYVPYGPISDVMPYLIRRAEENTSVAGQTGRELSLIDQELKRRAKT